MTTSPISSTPRLAQAPLTPKATRSTASAQTSAPAQAMPYSRHLRDIQAGDGCARAGMLARLAADSEAGCRARAATGEPKTATP